MTKTNIHETMFNRKQANIPLFHHNKVDCEINKKPFVVNIYFQVVFMVLQIRKNFG